MEEEIVYPEFLKEEDEEIRHLIERELAESEETRRILREKVVELICR